MTRPLRLRMYVSARPNYPKAWTFQRACKGLADLQLSTVHTGQHSDGSLGPTMASAMGVRLDRALQPAAAKSDAGRLAELIHVVDQDLHKYPTDGVTVIGDVNGTVAAALASRRRGLPVLHLEAGLRSGDDNPEEINRKCVTSLSQWHLATTLQARDNLETEGVSDACVAFIGNPMAECFLRHTEERDVQSVRSINQLPERYVLMTLHKPRTTRDPDFAGGLAKELAREHGTVVFPRHPSTVVRREALLTPTDGVHMLPPQTYTDFGALLTGAALVVTDSDGVHEECAIAGVPCLVLVPQSARPETHGPAHLATDSLDRYDVAQLSRVLIGQHDQVRPRTDIAGWDRLVSERIATALTGFTQHIRSTGVTDYWEDEGLCLAT